METPTRFYLLRKGETYKIARVDQDGAMLFHDQGWELWRKPLDSHEAAESAMEEWKNLLRQGR